MLLLALGLEPCPHIPPRDAAHILGCTECLDRVRMDPAGRPPFDPDGCRYGIGLDDGTSLAQCPHPANGDSSLCEHHLNDAADNWMSHVRETTDALERLANGEEPSP